MKKSLFYSIALLTAIAIVCACEDQHAGDKPAADTITVSDAFATPFSAPAAGVIVDNVTVEANKAWTSTVSNEFVTLSPTSGEAGTTTISVTIAENTDFDIRTADVTFTCGTAEVTVTVEQAAKTITDLSASATANCYVVPAAGTYKIKTVKGNSTESVGEVASAELVWSHSIFGGLNAVVTSDITYGDGYISFTTTGTDGNALIAAKDASGTILWSWHIWAIAEVPEIQLGTFTAQAYALGYTAWPSNDAYSWGLLYQWGRKDPFRFNWAAPTDPADAFTTGVTISEALNEGTSLAYSIAHPTHFITGTDTTYDWYAAEAANMNNSLWSTTKTIYDPCPAGYIVPSADLFAAIDASNITFEVTDVRHAMVYNNNDWYYSGSVEYNKTDAWSGWAYSGGWFWSNTIPEGSNFATSAYILGALDPAKNWYRGTAMAVRCVKE